MTPRAEQTLGLISRKHRLTPVLSFVDRALNLDWRTTAIARQPEKRNRLNGEILASEVRLIDKDGEQVGIVSIEEAKGAAEAADLDLVEIVPNAEPPVCRIMNYGKYVFELKKQKQEARKKQKQVQVKEVKFRPGTDIGDYQVKLRNLTRFLEDGDKAKVTMRFRGREHAHRERGLELLEKIESDLQEISQVEQRPMMEGRQMVMVLSPRKGK
jgi:translation initiation factor IF-3